MMTLTHEARLIGELSSPNIGTQVICLASIHGNEQAGVAAVRRIFKQLRSKNKFQKGRLVGLIGNLKALSRGERFIHSDLNRMWSSALIQQARDKTAIERLVEEQELFDLYNTIYQLVDGYTGPSVLIDLHTTSASGGAFSIIPGNEKSKKLASCLKVPIISGVEKVLKTTILSYFNHHNLPSLAFEAGQHNDPQSALNMEAALWITMSNYDMIENSCGIVIDSVETLNKAVDGDMPANLEFLYRHPVTETSKFRMKPGFINFMPVFKGQHLADDVYGPVLAQHDALILMPLYQSQGEDGFFLVKKN